MAIVAVNGGGNTPNDSAADGAGNTRVPRLDDVTDGTSNTLMVGEKFLRNHLVPVAGDGNGDGRGSARNADVYAGSHLLYQDVVVPLGEADDEALVLPSAPAGDGKAYVLTSVAHAATDTSGAGEHVDGFRFDLQGHHQAALDGGPTALAASDSSTSPTNQGWGHWEINLPPAQPGQPHTFGQPVTFTATIHPGYAGPVFVVSGDVDGAPNNLKQLGFATIDYDRGAPERVTDGTSNTLLFAEKYPRVGAWTPTDYCFEIPSTTGNAHPDGLSNTLAFGEGLVQTHWVPVVGDWNGDGRDSVGHTPPLNPVDTSGYDLSATHDGIDPIWIDVGAPVMSAPDGRRYDTPHGDDRSPMLKHDDEVLAAVYPKEGDESVLAHAEHATHPTGVDYAMADGSVRFLPWQGDDLIGWDFYANNNNPVGDSDTDRYSFIFSGSPMDGTSNTVMLGEADVKHAGLVPIFGDGSVRHISSGISLPDGNHRDWVIILQYDHAVTNDAGDTFVFDGSTGETTDPVGSDDGVLAASARGTTQHDLVIAKVVDKTTPLLFGEETLADWMSQGDHDTPAGFQNFSLLGTQQASGDDAGIAWVSGRGGIRGADTMPEADWLLL